MARFLSTALRPLGSIFGLKGSIQSTDELDLSGVQLTANVLDSIAQGRGIGSNGGWAFFFSNHLHNSQLDLSDKVTPYLGASAPSGLFLNGFKRVDPTEFTVWVFDGGVQHTNGTLGASFFAALKITNDVKSIGPQGGSVGSPPTVWLFAGKTDLLSPTLPSPVLNDLSESFRPFPIIGPDANIEFFSKSETGGVPTIQAWVLLRAIPRGLRP